MRAHVESRSESAVAQTDETSLLGGRLAIRTPPLVPELRLWLIADEVDLNARCEDLFQGGYAPYWAFCWGSGQALARYLLDNPELVRDRVVADFGSGSGVAAIAAARAGARRVVAVDVDRRAARFALRNAKLNAVQIETAGELPVAFDLLLASDVRYEPAAWALLNAQLSAGRPALVADPERQGTAAFDESPLARYEVRTFPDVDYPIASAALYLRAAMNGGTAARGSARPNLGIDQPGSLKAEAFDQGALADGRWFSDTHKCG